MNSWILVSLRIPLADYDPKTYLSDELEAQLPSLPFYEVHQRLLSSFNRELEATLDRSELDYYSPIMEYHFNTDLRADEVQRRLREVPALAEFAPDVEFVEDMSPEHEYALELEQIELELAQAQAEMEERAALWGEQDAEIAAKIGQRKPELMVDEATELLKTRRAIPRPTPSRGGGAARSKLPGSFKPGSSFGL